MGRDYKDLVIEELADSEAAQREQLDALIDLIAHLSLENFLLRRVAKNELVERVLTDGALDRERRRHRHARPEAA